jgi:uncharacterized protein
LPGQDLADINSQTIDNQTALHLAIEGQKLEAVKLLIKYKANIEAKTKLMRTPLILACIHGEKEIAAVLLNAGADVNAQDVFLNTAAHYCSEYCKTLLAAIRY